MPKNVSWDSSFDSSPADTDSVKDGALRIRETRLGVHERLELEHHFGTGAGDEEGRHKFPVGDVTARDGLIGVADQMIYFLEEVAGIYLQLRKDGAWTDIRCRNADHADSADAASNADRLDGYDAGNASGQVPISNGTLCIDLNADKLDGYDAGNSAGQVPVSNGTVCSGLNADLLDGKHAADLANNDLSNVDDNVVLTKVKNVDGAGSGLDADTVDGLHASSFANTSLSNVADSTVLAKVKNVDGSGSGLDADLLRGLPAVFDRSLASRGYQKLPGGLLIQWGQDAVGASGGTVASGSFSFPIPFNQIFSVVAVARSSANASSGYMAVLRVSSFSTTGFSVLFDTNAHTTITNTQYFCWIAIGTW